ncbi:MAG: hypothetical protein VB092_02160 [Oscillospiraceae bacterium]|nr:hypothetical protein [Oscillospiraceae bacterium]
MRVYLIFLLIVYFLYTTIKSLWEHGLPFDTVQWILVAMCAAFVPLGVIFGKKCWIQSKEDKAKREEEKLQAQEEATARKRNFYLDAEDTKERGDIPTADADASDENPDSPAPAEGTAAPAPELPENSAKNIFDC